MSGGKTRRLLDGRDRRDRAAEHLPTFGVEDSIEILHRSDGKTIAFVSRRIDVFEVRAMVRRFVMPMFIAAAFVSPARADDARASFFESRIRPVLVEQCYRCHSAEAKKQRGGLSLDAKDAVLKGGDSGPAIVAGRPGESLLVKAIRHQTPDLKMPPEGKLPAKVIADFERWIADGAFDPRSRTVSSGTGIDLVRGRRFWSFQPPTMPPLPNVTNTAWVRTPIDRFILAKLEAEGIAPSPEAERRHLIRRATFDVIGLPPTPEEVDSFVADRSPDAYERLVDRLLASPHYGERWARHWLDVARYAEDQAHTFGVKPNVNAYRYRDWVVAALNDDMPYDRFAKLQIAADLMDLSEEERSRHLPALGFLGLGAQYYKNSDAAKAAADELDDRIDTVTRGFLGLTVSCARCHDHKYDPIPQADYYSLAGVFASCRIAELPLGTKEQIARYNEGQSRLKKIEQDAKAFAKAEKTLVARGRVGEIAGYLVSAWRHQVNSGGAKGAAVAAESLSPGQSPEMAQRWAKFMQKPPALAALDACRRVYSRSDRGAEDDVAAAARAFQKSVTEALAAEASGSADKEQVQLLTGFFGDACPLFPTDGELAALLSTDKKRTLDAFADESAKVRASYPQTPPPTAHGVAETKVQNMKVFLRGDPARLGETAPRRFLRVLAGDDPRPFSDSSSGRRELAEAIASRDNPLTARVIVNRLWQRHFGRGIVGTPSNFGELGDRPSHPELLDYLAVRLGERNGSLKAIHREILTSAVYRQSAAGSPAGLEKDPDNRWLGRRDRQRLDIESWRDAMLAVSGRLDRAMGGPTFNLADSGSARRTVYARISRHNLDATLRLFDFPDANITSERRTETTVPQQQLFALNGPLIVESAKAFAARLQAEAPSDDAERVRRAFSLAFGRPPSDAEAALVARYLASADADGASQLTRWQRVAQSLLASNEFQYVD